MPFDISSRKAFLFDLDGTLTVDGMAIPGAVDTLRWLKDHGYPFRICTNTTTLSKTAMSAMLQNSGFPVVPDEVFTAPAAVAQYLRANSIRRCFKLISGGIAEDFTEFDDDTVSPSHIVIGDIGERWDYVLMTKLFNLMMDGATVIAMHKGRYWLSEGRFRLDIGAFLTGLEYATGKEVLIVGKPSPEFFKFALSTIGTAPPEAVMIGDDLQNDVKGAQDCGIAGVLVRTGKYRQDTAAQSTVKPDLILHSVAELPGLLTRP